MTDLKIDVALAYTRLGRSRHMPLDRKADAWAKSANLWLEAAIASRGTRRERWYLHLYHRAFHRAISIRERLNARPQFGVTA